MNQLLRGAGEPIHTVSACYANKEFDEKPFIDTVVETTRSQPQFVYPDPEQICDVAEKVIWHQDEPFGSTSIFAQWFVFEESRRIGVKVMLDGQGADEQLAGYRESFRYQILALKREGNWIGLARLMIDRKRWHSLDLFEQVMGLPGRPRLPSWLKSRRRQPVVDHCDWIDSPLLNAALTPDGAFNDVLVRDSIGPVEDIGGLCLADMVGASLPRLLRYEDRNSMAHSIEARVPFLDHRLVEFSLGLWDRHKIVGGDTKRVLRKAMKGRLPGKVAKRRDKLGFNTPEQSWFRGRLRPMIEAGVRSTLDLYPDLLNKRAVLANMDASLNGRHPVDESLWRIANLGIWGRVFKVGL
jgi:asparagine synthase (glutamine-hydrolysing)